MSRLPAFVSITMRTAAPGGTVTCTLPAAALILPFTSPLYVVGRIEAERARVRLGVERGKGRSPSGRHRCSLRRGSATDRGRCRRQCRHPTMAESAAVRSSRSPRAVVQVSPLCCEDRVAPVLARRERALQEVRIASVERMERDCRGIRGQRRSCRIASSRCGERLCDSGGRMIAAAMLITRQRRMPDDTISTRISAAAPIAHSTLHSPPWYGQTEHCVCGGRSSRCRTVARSARSQTSDDPFLRSIGVSFRSIPRTHSYPRLYVHLWKRG